MKSLILVTASLLFSSIALAETPSEFVRKFQQSEEVSCSYSHSSSMEYCFNYTCVYKKYYACTSDTKDLELELKIRSIRYPGEIPDDTVTGYNVR